MSHHEETSEFCRSTLLPISSQESESIRGGGVGGAGSLPQLPNLGKNLRAGDADDDGVLPKK